MTQTDLEQARVGALQSSTAMICSQRITGDAVRSLFLSAELLAVDVMKLDTLHSIVFAMRFGSVMLLQACLKDTAQIHHADGSITSVPLNIPAEMPRSMARYVSDSFSRFAGTPQVLFRVLCQNLSEAGITSDLLEATATLAELMATEVWLDEAKWTPAYFTHSVKRLAGHPSFVLDERAYSLCVE